SRESCRHYVHLQCHTVHNVFLTCPRPPLHLHSFPTRRSSDLERHEGADSHQHHRPGAPPRERRHRVAPSRRSSSRAVARAARERSEEHTSELQSRFDLVCRLLLEKKKQRYDESTNATTSTYIR